MCNINDLFVKIEPNQIIQTPETLNITTQHTSIPMDRTVYVIQAKIDGKWKDVIVTKGTNPAKTARYYRNRNNIETRVIRIIEHCSFSYEYEIINVCHLEKECL